MVPSNGSGVVGAVVDIGVMRDGVVGAGVGGGVTGAGVDRGVGIGVARVGLVVVGAVVAGVVSSGPVVSGSQSAAAGLQYRLGIRLPVHLPLNTAWLFWSFTFESQKLKPNFSR
jgi:hypothetical protein